MRILYFLLPITFIAFDAAAQEGDLFQDPEVRQKEKFQQERKELRRSWTEDEDTYYRDIAPHEVDDPNYFEKDHPLEEKPLDESLLK